MRSPVIAGFLVLLSATSVAGATTRQAATAFEDVTLVDTGSGKVVSGQTVLIRDRRIERVGPAGSISLTREVLRIDGRGRYLLPGLVDIHAHVTRSDFPLFLRNGVTTVREMNGSIAHLAWRDSIQAGRLPGPSLVVTSPLLPGEPQRYRHQLVRSPEEAVAAVRLARSRGYDAIKVYDGLTPASYRALAAEAEQAGMMLTGHVPQAVGIAGVLAARQRSIEHTQEILRGLPGHPPDSASISQAVSRLKGHRVWVTPTLAVFERLSLAASAEVQALLDRPEVAYVDTSLITWWNSFRRRDTGAASPRAVALAEAHRQVVRELIAQGIPILVGTDTPNPFMVPGYSLHDEIDALHRAGLSRPAVLRAATLGAAEFLSAGDQFGSVRPGLRADLVLLSGNPLEDLSVLRNPLGVMVAGIWYWSEDLERLMVGR